MDQELSPFVRFSQMLLDRPNLPDRDASKAQLTDY
jgi:hypothetical protein